MRYSIDMAIFGTLPEFTRAVLVARDLDNTQRAAASRNMFQKAAQVAGATFADQAPAEHAKIAPWQQAYDSFGMAGLLDTQQNIPSSLIFRTHNTPLANVLNAFGVQSLLPTGGDDLDEITGNVWLQPARGTELFVPVGQPERPTAPAIGEIIYVDDGPSVLRRRWHSLPGDSAAITAQTRNALIYLDCLPPVDRAKAEELTSQLGKLITAFFNTRVETHFLTRKQPAIEVAKS